MYEATEIDTSALTVVIEGLGRGGAQRVASQLIDYWVASGRRVFLITFDGSENDCFSVPEHVTREVIGGLGASKNPIGGLLANLRRIVRLRRAIRMSGADTVVSFIATTNILTTLACTGLGVRTIICERSDPKRQLLSKAWRLLRGLTYPRADMVTANTRGSLEALKDFVPASRLAYVPNPLPPPPSNVVADLTAPTVVTVGRLNRVKAHDVLLRAFAIFHCKQPAWRLAIVGDGAEEERLRALASELRIAGAVDWIQDVDDPYPWLRAARIFALPSRFEGLPNALLEAMSCRLPCIVSDASPGPLELIEDGVNGLVVPVEDWQALATAFQQLVDDERLAQRFEAAAHERVADFAPANAMKIWDHVLQRAGGPS